MKTSLFTTLAVLTIGAVSAHAQAFVTPDFALAGPSVSETWTFNTANGVPYDGAASGQGAWTTSFAPIGGGDSLFTKSAGGGYTTGSSIYTLFSPATTYTITNNNVLADLETIFFQVKLTAQQGVSDILLSINGGTPASYDGVFTIYSTGASFGEDEGIAGTFGFQWDLSQFAGTINSFEISFTAGMHTSLESVRVDQGSVYAQAIPEPSTYALMALAGAGVVWMRRRKVA